MELTFLHISIVLTNVNKTEFSDKAGTCPRARVLPVQWVLEGHNIFTA